MEEMIRGNLDLPVIPIAEDMETFLSSQDFFGAILKLPRCQVSVSGNLLWINAGKTHLMVRTSSDETSLFESDEPGTVLN